MDVKLVGYGSNSDTETQVDPTWNAARASLRALEVNNAGVLGGHYAVTAITGTIAAAIANNSQIFQIRWADSTKLFILKKLTASAQTITGFAATTSGADLELVIGHGSSANGSGGAAVTPTSTSNMLRKTFAPSAFVASGEIRVATTGALTAATGQTLEPAGVGYCNGAPAATNTHNPKAYLFEQRDFGTHPLILVSGDTLVVRSPLVSATGTWRVGFEIEWAEASVY